MPKINGNEIKPGFIMEHDGGLWAAVKVNHVKPGKGGAFAQVELKNLRDGRKLNERFRSEDKVERVELENKDQQFLYETDGRLVFMDTATYEQVEIDAEFLGDLRGAAGEHQIDGARKTLGHAYGGGSQFFAMWVVGADKPTS